MKLHLSILLILAYYVCNTVGSEAQHNNLAQELQIIPWTIYVTTREERVAELSPRELSEKISLTATPEQQCLAVIHRSSSPTEKYFPICSTKEETSFIIQQFTHIPDAHQKILYAILTGKNTNTELRCTTTHVTATTYNKNYSPRRDSRMHTDPRTLPEYVALKK